MAYVQPRTALSSIRIEGGVDSPYSDEYDSMHVDLELIRNEPDIRLNLLDAITRAFRELGIECFGGCGDYKRPIAVEIGDEDVDKVVNLDIEIEADEILDEDDCKMYLIEYDNFVPRLVKLTGLLWIDGFAVVGQWKRER